MGGALAKTPEAALAGAAPYLRLFGLACGGIYLAKGALCSSRDSGGSGAARQISLARFYAENLATSASGLKDSIVSGADSTPAADALSI